MEHRTSQSPRAPLRQALLCSSSSRLLEGGSALAWVSMRMQPDWGTGAQQGEGGNESGVQGSCSVLLFWISFGGGGGGHPLDVHLCSLHFMGLFVSSQA